VHIVYYFSLCITSVVCVNFYIATEFQTIGIQCKHCTIELSPEIVVMTLHGSLSYSTFDMELPEAIEAVQN